MNILRIGMHATYFTREINTSTEITFFSEFIFLKNFRENKN